MFACKILIQTQIIKTQTQTLLKNSLEQNKTQKKVKERERKLQKAYYKSETGWEIEAPKYNSV